MVSKDRISSLANLIFLRKTEFIFWTKKQQGFFQMLATQNGLEFKKEDLKQESFWDLRFFRYNFACGVYRQFFKL
ncbi:hypothetical protein [uncultured Flavobacterium sp.]|uniref:hypothetical protein n=1 Tax=uncultured Flavobacterium sp. TaxID=165435 RepID=UPI0025F2950D|nr:hypothetical protein [uncultured Flavobacterium sp.]